MSYRLFLIISLIFFSHLSLAQFEISGKVEKIELIDIDKQDWLNEKPLGTIGKHVVTAYKWKAFKHKGIEHFNVYLSPENKTNVDQYVQFRMNFYDSKGNKLGRDIEHDFKVKPKSSSSMLLNAGIKHKDLSKVAQFRISYKESPTNPDTYDYNANAEQREFLEKIVSVINAKDRAGYKTLVHPSYKGCASKEYAIDLQERHIDFMLSRPVPDGYKAQRLPLEKGWIWPKKLKYEFPIQPEVQLIAVFDEQAPSSRCEPNMRYTHNDQKVGPMVIKDQGRYWIVEPCLQEKNAETYRKLIDRRQEVEASIKAKVKEYRNKLAKKDIDFIVETAVQKGTSTARDLLESKYKIKDRAVRYHLFRDICRNSRE